jgi:hypothetical protein
MNAPLPRTENPDFGFYGTTRSAGYDPDAAWAIALPIVAAFWPTAHARIAARRARIFLDSSGGRHLADSVLHRNDLEAAIRDVLPSFYGWLR